MAKTIKQLRKELRSEKHRHSNTRIKLIHTKGKLDRLRVRTKGK